MTSSNRQSKLTSSEYTIQSSRAESQRERLYSPSESLQPTVTVGREYVPTAIQHGMELWWDGSTPTKRLDERGDSSKFTRFVNARVEGKLCEVAFMQFLEENFNLRSQVDWRIYGDYDITDDGDLQHLLDKHGLEFPLGVDLEIKKTKPWNQWLAVRQEIFDQLSDEAPIILAKARIDSDIQLDPWQDTEDWDDVDLDEEFRSRLLNFARDEFPMQVTFAGTVYKDEFTDHFNKGDRLYKPSSGDKIGPRLKRPNMGVHVSDLNNSPARWNRVVADLVGDNPAELWRPLPVVDQ